MSRKINPAACATTFRIRNDSRTNGGCKPVFDQAIELAIGKPSPFLMSREEGEAGSATAHTDDSLW